MIKCCSILMLLGILLPSVAAADDSSLTVINRTGRPIIELYATPSGDETWGDDFLKGNQLLSEKYSVIDVERDDGGCFFNFKAIDADGDVYLLEKHDICRVSKVAFTINHLLPIRTEKKVPQSITVVNSTGQTIYGLYVSPDFSETWEEELLGKGEVLIPGETYELKFAGYGSNTIFDIRIVDEDGDEYFKWSINVSDTNTLTFTLNDMQRD